MDKEPRPGMLSPYLVLDLTDEEGLICGKLLADLGADVIKVESPEGSLARQLPPFYQDEKDPEKSLPWFAYNTGKRSITLNLEVEKGRDIFRKLATFADVVVESYPPGYLEAIGLGHSILGVRNRGLIMTSITPFGESGPYRDYLTSDLVAMAMGGMLYITGDADRPPLRISVEQSYLHAGLHAAVGTMLALKYRQVTGEGQQVNVSIQQSVVLAIAGELTEWEYKSSIPTRMGSQRHLGNIVLRQVWKCKDGHVAWRFFTGPQAGDILRLRKLMESEGAECSFISETDWGSKEIRSMSQEEVDLVEKEVGNFFLTHTMGELYQDAQRLNIALTPVTTLKECLEDDQLKSRGFWIKIKHPELNRNIVYPGSFFRSTEASPDVKLRAPMIGEHNEEIYAGLLGFSRHEMAILRKEGII